jgi:hypothetical protein
MRRIEASFKKATPLQLRFSQWVLREAYRGDAEAIERVEVCSRLLCEQVGGDRALQRDPRLMRSGLPLSGWPRLLFCVLSQVFIPIGRFLFLLKVLYCVY